MKTLRVLARARNGVPTLRVPTQQNRLFTRIASSASAATRSSSATSSAPIISPQTYPSRLRLQGRRSYASNSEAEPQTLGKTSLYDLHVARGAKMVPFGGYYMPVQYANQSVITEHTFTRTHASLFDVGHMVQHRFNGPGALAFLQRITPASLEPLPSNSSTLSTLMWPQSGGIVDDTIITKLGPESFYVVTNAGCRDKDLAYLKEQLELWNKDGKGLPVEHTVLEGQGLVALQGPAAAAYLTPILANPQEADLSTLFFGQCRSVSVKVDGGNRVVPDVLVSRGGYTGEDGFEISIPAADTVAVTEALLQVSSLPEKLRLAGLGARDSLRLEAGMCLYGHDLDDSTTPVEGALSWIIGKDRRSETDVAKGAFYGAHVVLPQLKTRKNGGTGVERRRVGLVVEKGPPARESAEIVDAEGNKVGVVTSGCPSPTLGENIAMGYVKDGLHKAGTELEVLVRGRKRKATVTKMPFVPSKYYKGAK